MPVLATCVELAPFAASPAAPSAFRVACATLPASDSPLIELSGLRLPVLSSSLPARYYLQLSLQVTPVSCSQRFSFGLAPSAVLSGRASNELALAFRADWRPASTLITCRTPSSPAMQLVACAAGYMLVAAPTTKPLAYARCSNPSAKLATSSRVSVDRCESGLRRLPAARLLPFPESFS